jgi:hypothetical protein
MSMSNDTFLRSDDSAFTLGLFDNSALANRTGSAPSTASESFEADVDDAEADDCNPMLVPSVARGRDFHLDGDRNLASGWAARARDNTTAISLSKTPEQSQRAPTPNGQEQLLRFIGFGATELAQNCFRRRGETEFRPEWHEIAAAPEAAVSPAEYATLRRATQCALYAGDGHPWTLASRRTHHRPRVRLYRTPSMAGRCWRCISPAAARGWPRSRPR